MVPTSEDARGEADYSELVRGRVHDACRRLIVVLLVLTSVMGFVSGVLLDEQELADIVGEAMNDESVRTAIAGTAVDQAFDTFKVDQTLASALPDQLTIAASPAVELSKPVVAEAGSQLLALEPAQAAVSEATRSVHRQTAAAAFSPVEQDVVINTRPILVVVADEIIGPAGARAAVGLDLPESATSVNLGSNQSALWQGLNLLIAATGILALLLMLTAVVYFATAVGKLQAAADLGRPFITAGIVTIAVSALLALSIALAAESLLGSNPGFSVAGIDVGQVTGGAGLGFIITAPLSAAARRLLYVGLVFIFATRLFTDHPAAVAFREAVRHRDPERFIDGLARLLPDNLRRVQLGIYTGGLLVLWFSSDPGLRRTLTVLGVVAAAQVGLLISTSTGARWERLREVVGWNYVEPLDHTDRTEAMRRRRRILGIVAVVALLFWPTYTAGSVRILGLVGLGLAAWTYRTEVGEVETVAPVALADAPENTALWRRPRVLAPVVCTVLVGLLLLPDQGVDIATASAQVETPTRCNGLEELCGRPFDQVVFAGTHNAMSAEELGWELANHQTAIPAQLAGGIRALLVDVQKWEVDVSLGELSLDPEAAQLAAEALSGAQTPEDGLWMCHKLCQLGGTPFRDFIADLRAFLETNPDEVVLVVIQDEAEKVDIKSALVDGGLRELAYEHPPGQSWPTLGEMIANNERVVFLAENDGDATGWYQAVYDGNVTETNFRYSVVSDFECAPNRGVENSDLFLINHWVETGVPVPSDADVVNSREVLLARVDECRRVRGREPGVIAVNFWERGDVIEVVEDLNLR